MCGGRRLIAVRAPCGVSPLRTSTRTSGSPAPAPQLRERAREILLHVVAERLERRDVEHMRLVLERGAAPQQLVDRPQERGERLPGSGGRRDQRVPAGADARPAFDLGRRGLADALAEPALDDGMKMREGHGEELRCCGCARGARL
jgi:hypothetical protein